MFVLIFLGKRVLQALIVMLIISIIGFSIKNNLGDPLRELVGQSVSEAERNLLREQMGLNDPLLTQYMRFIGKAVQGDFGMSYFFKKPALQVILDKFPATFELVLISAALIIMLSIPTGMFAALKPDSLGTKIIMGLSVLGISTPIFLTAIFLIYMFSVQLGWLPSFGRGETITLPWGWETGLLTRDGWQHIILPAVSLTSLMLPLFIRLIRAEMIEALDSEYVRFAFAKGLSRWTVWIKHAFRNTLLPVVTIGGVQIGTLIAYTILTETVFQWPGMGFLFLEAINRTDTTLIITYIIFVGFVFVVVNTLVDTLYIAINPRIRFSSTAS